VEGKLNDGELTMSPITFQDISKIKEVFKKRLMAIYHTRISYPAEQKQ
jgi:membrane-associated HD superfamily phosphohydrolase